MSHWNQLENQLRSWTPRKPSPSLEARLFARPSARDTAESAAERTRDGSPAAWHWLAPAMAVFVFGAILFGNHPGAFSHFDTETRPRALARAALTQPDFSTYYAEVRHSENNALRTSFEWTNDNRSLRTAPPVAQTNSVLQ